MPTAGSRVEAKAVDNHAYRLYFAMKSYRSAVVNTSESASLVHTPNIVAHVYDSKKSVGIAYLCSQEVRWVVGGFSGDVGTRRKKRMFRCLAAYGLALHLARKCDWLCITVLRDFRHISSIVIILSRVRETSPVPASAPHSPRLKNK